MAINFTITNTVATTAQDSGHIRLFHGTRMAMAESIVTHGISGEKAAMYGTSKDFWATLNAEVAMYYSKAPPETGWGESVVLGFDLPEKAIQDCLERLPQPWAYVYSDGRYRFLCPAHAVLNSQMTNTTMTIV